MGILSSLFGGSSTKIGAVPGWNQPYQNIMDQQTGLGLAGKLAKRTLRFFNDPGSADYTEAPGFAPMAQAIKASAAGAQAAGDRGISRRLAFESPESGAALGASMSAENAGRIGAGLGSTMANALTNYRSGAEGTYQGAKNEMEQHNLGAAMGAGQFFLGAHPTMTSSTGGIIPGIASLMSAGGGLASGLAKFASPSGGCWIAEALYGVDAPETHLLRFWLNQIWAPASAIGAAFMWLYLRFGERFAVTVKQSRAVRVIIRPAFNYLLRRAQSWQSSTSVHLAD